MNGKVNSSGGEFELLLLALEQSCPTSYTGVNAFSQVCFSLRDLVKCNGGTDNVHVGQSMLKIFAVRPGCTSWENIHPAHISAGPNIAFMLAKIKMYSLVYLGS